MPGENVVLRDEDIGVSVSCKVQEAEIGIAPLDVWLTSERGELGPTILTIALEESGVGPIQLDKVGQAITGKVLEVGSRSESNGRFLCYQLLRTKPAVAEIRLVPPRAPPL